MKTPILGPAQGIKAVLVATYWTYSESLVSNNFNLLTPSVTHSLGWASEKLGSCGMCCLYSCSCWQVVSTQIKKTKLKLSLAFESQGWLLHSIHSWRYLHVFTKSTTIFVWSSGCLDFITCPSLLVLASVILSL